MIQTAKLKRFETEIFNTYKDQKSYEKLRRKVLNIRETMLKYPWFRLLSAKKQFSTCCTIALIVTDSLRQFLNENRPISKKDETPDRHPYSVDRISSSELKTIENSSS